MYYRYVKTTLATCLAVCTLLGNGVMAEAKTAASVLPAAGIGLSLEEGSSLKDIQKEVEADSTQSNETKEKKEIVEPTNVTYTKEEVQQAVEKKEFSNLVIAQVHDYVNVRNMPSEEGEIVGKLYDKSVGTFLEEENGWYKIHSGNCEGYVKGEFCVTGEDAVELAKKVGTRIATVNTTTLKVREEASMEASVLGLVPIEEQLVVTEELDGWVKVDIEEGFGYVSTEFVNLSTEFVKAESKAEEEARLKKEAEERRLAQAAANKSAKKSSKKSGTSITASATGSAEGQAVANYGLQFVGNPYVYGGSSLTNGTDCSGFVMSVYKNFGVSLPHSSAADRKVGYDVGGLDNAQPGDIVCYSGHVALYIGNGQIVHASTSKTGIIVSNANYRNILAVRRIF